MKYKVLFKTFGKPKRGAHLTTHLLKTLDSRIESIDIESVQNINDIRDSESTLVFRTQGIHLYNKKYNFLKAKPTDVVFIRHEYSPRMYNNPVNNGFSYSQVTERGEKKFIRDNYIKYFSPILYNFNDSTVKNFDEPVIGYYLRPTLTPDSTNWFLEFLDNLETPVKIFTMGIEVDYNFHKNVISQTHTYNNHEFFDNVTHYIYFKSNTFKDPYPHSLMEAVQSGCQIIVPDNARRFDDGIDDILSSIEHHKSFNSEIIDNSSSVLNKDFNPYIKELIDKGFLFTEMKDMKNYKNFKEWIVENVR